MNQQMFMKYGPVFVGAAVILIVLSYFVSRPEPSINEPALTLSSPWQDEPESRLRLVSASTATSGDMLSVGLQLEMTKGWKTYWRNSGDSGFAPQFDWSGSTNVRNVDIYWPAPQAFDEAGERYYGYKDQVLWPLYVTPEDETQPVTLSLTLNYGVCLDVCIPVRGVMSLHVPRGEAEPTKDQDLITAAMNLVPQTVEGADVRAAVHLVDVTGHRAQLQVKIDTSGFKPNLVIVTGGPGSYFGGSKPDGEKGFRIPLDASDPEALKGTEINLLFLSEEGTKAAEGNFVIQ